MTARCRAAQTEHTTSLPLSRRSVLAGILCIVPAWWVAPSRTAAADEPGDASPDLVRFADPKRSEDEALRAEVRLRGDKHPPSAQALLAIANNDRSYSDVRRRRAVILFLRYHAAPPTPLSEVGAHLHRAGHGWLARENVRAIRGLGGKTPVRMTPGRVFWLKFGLPKDDSSTVYLRVEGELTEDQFWDVLRNANGGDQATNRILQIGYSLSDSHDERLLPKGEQ
jgi:hypothetical protein